MGGGHFRPCRARPPHSQCLFIFRPLFFSAGIIFVGISRL